MKIQQRTLGVCVSIFIIGLVVACAAPTATTPPQPTVTIVVPATIVQPTATRPPTSASSLLPIYDGHLHYSMDVWSDYPVPQVISLLDQLGIKRALVSSTPNEGTLRLYQADPTRIIPELRPYRTRDDMTDWFSNPQIVAMIEEELRRGVYRGIGEFHLDGDKAKTPQMKRIVDLAVERGLPLHAHSDEQAIEHLFAVNPRAKILWAHTGFTTPPARIAQMFERYPNLWAELSYRSDLTANGKLSPEWRALFTRFPDRFVYGSDTWIESRWDDLPNLISTARGWLVELPSDVAEKISQRNLEVLYGK